MIREKIFRLHRHKSALSLSLSSSSPSTATDDASASGDKFDFTFSDIQAFQVPKGWDKLSLSLISSESGKAVCKSGKVSVKNGLCQWRETLSESIWIPDVDSSEELQEYHLKFLVSTGSLRSGILGEATLNLALFLSSGSPMLVSLPLQKCNHGTVLQVEVACLTPKTNLRNEKWKNMHAHKDENTDLDGMENQSESCHSSNFGHSSHPQELGSRETSVSLSVSHYSLDSMDDSVERQGFSSQSDQNGGNNGLIRQDSIESSDGASYCSHSIHGSIKSVCSLQSPFARENQGNNQREELLKLQHATSPLLQQNGHSSKAFKENDAPVQEFDIEARIWEQNARKLAVDLENLRKELSDQNLNMANMKIELAASYSECDKLTQEIEHLKFLLEKSIAKQSISQNSELQQTTSWSNIQMELEDETRCQKEENKNLSLQLKKTQESNIELISILQEMEETVEKQKLEIESHSAKTLESICFNAKLCPENEDCAEVNVIEKVSASELSKFHDCESDTSINYKISAADIHEQILQENNCSLDTEFLNLQELQQSQRGEILVLESILEDNIIETEIEQDLKNCILKGCVVECNHRLDEKRQQIMNLEAELSRARSDENVRESAKRGHGDASKEIEQLKEKVWELEADCEELTKENLELLFELKGLRKNVTKESNASLISSSHEVSVNGSYDTSTSEVRIREHEDEREDLEFQSQSFMVIDCSLVCPEEAQEQEAETIELKKPLVSKQELNNSSTTANVFMLASTRDFDELLQALLEQLQIFLGRLKEESDLLLPHVDISSAKMRVNAVLNKILLSQHGSVGSIEERRQGQKNVCEGPNTTVYVILEESTPGSCVEQGNSSNDEPTSSSRYLSNEMLEQNFMILEANVDSLKKENDRKAPSNHKESMERNGTVSISDDMVLSSSSISSPVPDNKIDEMRFLEVESIHTEWMKHLTELQEENIYLSERIFGLEAQLRYLTDVKESSRLASQQSDYQVRILQNQIRRLKEEIETQKLVMKQKLLEMQERWSEAREECTSLSKLNRRLRATTESLIEEHNSLQKFNGELREKNSKLQEQRMFLEAEARNFRNFCCNCPENIGTLEEEYSLLKQEITAKVIVSDSKVDPFNVQTKECLERAEDASKLELKVACGSGQVSATYVEVEQRSQLYGYEDINEIHSTLDGVQENRERLERENNVEKLLKLFENVMKNESKRKLVMDELDSKIKLSELEKFQLAEENCVLQMQLQKVPDLQNEILSLRISLKEMESQTQLLQASFKSVSVENEELKLERMSMVQKISSMQKVVSEAEDCRRRRNALEEKILRLEGDLIARDAFCVQEAEMKNELSQFKIANGQLLLKVKHLEDIREDLQSRLQSFEKELKQTRHPEESHRKSSPESWFPHSHFLDTNTTLRTQLLKVKEDICVSADHRNLSIHLSRSGEQLKIKDNQGLFHDQVQVFSNSHSRKSQVSERDYESKIQLLENELHKALEANDIYRSQLDSAKAVASKKSESKEAIDSTKNEHQISLVEAELQELRERYLQMSLKYAEVEAQREELVMKLKGLIS